MPSAKRTAQPTPPRNPPRCAVGVCDPERTQGLLTSPAQGSHELVSLSGSGLFLSANIAKQGGANDLTFVRLDLDGRNVVDLSFAALRNWGLIQPNPFGIQFLPGSSVESFAIGWPFPLRFKRSLTLSVMVNESDVVQIVANVVHANSG